MLFRPARTAVPAVVPRYSYSFIRYTEMVRNLVYVIP